MDTQSLAFFVLILLYCILLALAGVRLRYLPLFKWGHTQLLFVLLTIQISFRLVALLGLAVEKWFDMDALFVLMTLPNCMFVVVFWVLFWHMFSVFLHAYLDTNAKTSLLRRTRTNTQRRALAKFFVFTSGMWLATQAILYACVIYQKVPRYGVDIEIAVVDLTAAGLVVLSSVIMNVQYSGLPHRSARWVEAQSKTTQTLCLWSCGRCVQGIVRLFVGLGTLTFTAPLGAHEASPLVILIVVSTLLFCEVLCALVVLDYSFIQVFIEDGEQEIEEEEEEEIQESSRVVPITRAEINYIRFLGKKESRGFGELTVVDFRGRETCYRRFKFNRVSGFVTDEFLREVAILTSTDVQFSVLPLGVTIALPEFGILTPYMPGGSLFYHLHESPRKLSVAEKVQILRDVACCLHSFHAHGRCHGHLSSHNVLLDNSRRGFVCDWGFTQLKKFAGIAMDYCNKTAWSSPEVLCSQGSTSASAKSSDDVYSFGILVWECFTEQIPFPGLALQQLQHVVKAGYRVQIPARMDTEIVAILKSCWNQEPERRPELRVLEASLASL